MRRPVWLKYLLVYSVWVVVLALGLWVLLLGRDALLTVFAMWFVEDTTAGPWQLASLERFYVIGAGLAWLALMVITEFYFRNGVHRGRMFQRFARILSVEMLALFCVDAALFVTQGLGTVVWSRWLVLVVELVLGVAFLLSARSAPPLLSDIKADYPD